MSAEQLAYAIITPYSLHKSRTGGILARLISRTSLDLAGARMFAPSTELVEKYSSVLVSSGNEQDRRVQTLIKDYVTKYFVPDPKTRRSRRVMVLLFRGEDAVEKIRNAVGNFSVNRVGGETIRDTFGDLVFDEHDNVRYFEPAVLAAPNVEEARVKLRLWAGYSDSDGGILKDIIPYPTNIKPQRTLVLIKPDNFRFSTGRPGNVIDFFSRTGLFIVGIKLHCMSVAEAMEFYGPVREVLREKLTGVAAIKAKTALENEFKFDVPQSVAGKLGELMGPLMGDNQFENIIKFMSGSTPTTCEPQSREKPGTEKCIALVYEGENAVRKIREVLGPTDPSKAPPGSIRREFGQTIMVNAAHASDSEDNARREMGIIGINRNNFREVVESFYGKA